jgi:bifunctional DNA-binding transcriptional regulator/antitoxin component of YhaV-PrlF toxin-antitoxin module
MRTIHYTGKVDENGSLTIPRDALDGLAVQPGDELDVSVRPYLRTESEPPEERAAGEPKSLADLFAGYIGGFKSGRTEERLSENRGEKFTDYLIQKRKEGHL